MTFKNEDITWLDLYLKVKSKDNIAIVIRHANRDAFPSGTPNINIPLNQDGLQAAIEVGKIINGSNPIQIITSPIRRCRETAARLMKGIGRDCNISDSSMLGKHGPYVIDSRKTSLLMDEYKTEFVHHHIAGEFNSNVIFPPHAGTISFITWLQRKMNDMENGLQVFISHDLIVSTILYSLFGYNIRDNGLVNFLDGFICTYDENGLTISYAENEVVADTFFKRVTL